nr:MAG TPA: hypothetical protein [Caudoviricetes sp.]
MILSENQSEQYPYFEGLVFRIIHIYEAIDNILTVSICFCTW